MRGLNQTQEDGIIILQKDTMASVGQHFAQFNTISELYINILRAELLHTLMCSSSSNSSSSSGGGGSSSSSNLIPNRKQCTTYINRGTIFVNIYIH